MYSENKVSLIGHVGRADVKTSEGGTKYAQISLATHERWGNEDGTKGERTTWVPLVTFKPKLIALIEKHIRKGAYLKIEATLRSGSYTKGDDTIYTLEVHATKIGFLQASDAAETDTDEVEA